MDIEAFAGITQNIIRDNGFDDFIPVACFPERREIRGLEGKAPGADIEKEALDWATSLAEQSEEFLVAFKVSDSQFKIVRYLHGALESAIFSVQAATANDLQSEVQRMADLALDNLQERAGGALDYSPESLDVVEEILAEASQHFSEMPDEQIRGLVQQVGCYILEVAYKKFGGQYLWHDDQDAPVLVVGEPDKHVAIVTWGKVNGRLAGDPGDNIAYFFEGFAERAALAPAGTKALYV